MSLCECGCGGTPNKGKRFCHGHWSKTQQARRSRIRRRIKVTGNPSKYCACGCGGVAPISKTDKVSRGYRAGQRAFYIHGHALKNRKGPDASRWKGGQRINGYGYIEIHCPEHPFASKRDGYMQEHRLVMEKKLGRYLDPDKERVHHINGVRTDNRPENLVVLTRSEHAKIHAGKLTEWVKRNAERKGRTKSRKR